MTDTANNLSGHVAVVTGASRGIGHAVATELAACGATVAGIARNVESATVSDRIGMYACDVTDRDQVAAAFERIEKDLGPVDILVNNAGIGRYGPFMSVDDDAWSSMLEVNVVGTVRCIRAVLDGMIERGDGLIINIGSRQGLVPAANATAYGATKFATTALTKSLAKEVGPQGVRVALVCPSGVLTDFADMTAGTKPPHWLDPATVARSVRAVATMPRNVLVSDLTIVSTEDP